MFTGRQEQKNRRIFLLIYPNRKNKNKFIEIYFSQTEKGINNIYNLSNTNSDYIILDDGGEKVSVG